MWTRKTSRRIAIGLWWAFAVIGVYVSLSLDAGRWLVPVWAN